MTHHRHRSLLSSLRSVRGLSESRGPFLRDLDLAHQIYELRMATVADPAGEALLWLRRAQEHHGRPVTVREVLAHAGFSEPTVGASKRLMNTLANAGAIKHRLQGSLHAWAHPSLASHPDRQK